MPEATVLDALDRAIVDGLQGGFPICERPYAEAARALGIAEEVLIARLESMLETRVLTRFGPMFQIERMGGAFVLAAMSVPDSVWERVVGVVNSFPEVAHNYQRESWRSAERVGDLDDLGDLGDAAEHNSEMNMWFVLATETPDGIGRTIEAIETATGLPVFPFPKLREYFVEMRLAVRRLEVRKLEVEVRG